MDEATKLRAYAMRMEGMSWDAIAEILHYDRTTLAKAVNATGKRRKSRRKRRKKHRANP